MISGLQVVRRDRRGGMPQDSLAITCTRAQLIRYCGRRSTKAMPRKPRTSERSSGSLQVTVGDVVLIDRRAGPGNEYAVIKAGVRWAHFI